MAESSTATSTPRAPLWRGRPVTPERIVAAFTRQAERLKDRSARIVEAQGLRRGTLTVSLSRAFIATHPEIAASSLSLLPQREGLERDLVAKAGAAEPVGTRAALNDTETAARQADEFEAYMQEVADSDADGVPTQTCVEKAVEDGEFGAVCFPSDLDLDGMPDLFDRIDQRSYDALKPAERKAYKPDPNRKGRYGKYRPDGSRAYNPKYDKGNPDKTKSAHQDAVRRYLVDKPAASKRVVPALDCVPFLVRGRGRRRWECVALIERMAVEPEELERSYGWAMLGDQLLLPRGFDPKLSGDGDCPYLYSMYYLWRDPKTGIERTVCCYTVGGAGTWRIDDPEAERKRSAPEATGEEVGWIDLYEERGLEGRFFDYFHALHTSDDDPNWYGRPYLWSLKNRILNIEQLETAANAAVSLSAYTGHFMPLNGGTIEALDRIDPESVVDAATHQIRRPKMPLVGDIEPTLAPPVPAIQTRIGDDAWRLQQNYQQSLLEATAIDQMPQSGPSGQAMMVSESLGQVAKRHVREAALQAWEFFVSRDAMIRQAAYQEYDIRWPINTARERAVGTKMVDTSTVVEWDPAWVGDPERIGEGNYTIVGDYPKEFNLARADLEINGYLKGVRGLKHVAEAFGEPDLMAFRIELAKDKLWQEPDSQMLLRSVVDQLRGMKKQMAAAKLQAQMRMTQQGVPGAPSGVPTAMLRRMGEGMAQGQPQQGGGSLGGRPSIASSIRGGVASGAQQASAAVQNAVGQLGAA